MHNRLQGVKKLKKRLLDLALVVISVFIAVLVGFYIVPRDNRQTRETSMVIQLRTDLGRNQRVKDSDLEIVEKGSYGLPKDTITERSEIVGKYAKTELPKGIILQSAFFQDDKEPLNAFLYENPELDGISFDTNLTRSVAGIAEKGDYVRAIIYLRPEDRGVDSKVLMLEELSNLEIISISNSRGKSLDEVDEKLSNDNSIPAVVTVKANKHQQALLVKYMNDGILHLSLRPRILADNKTQGSMLEVSEEYSLPVLTTEEKENKDDTRKGFGIN